MVSIGSNLVEPETRVLQALKAQDYTTRSRLAAATGLSRAAIAQALRELEELDLVKATGGKARASDQGGRPAETVRFEPRAGVVLGIDIGYSHLRVAAGDLAGQPLADVDRQAFETITETLDGRPLRIEETPALAYLELAAEAAGVVLQRSGVDAEDVRGVTIGLPGPVDRYRGVIASHGIMRPWRSIRPAEQLQHRLPLPNATFRVQNDANLAALAEARWQVGPDKVVLYVKWASGIGLGFVQNGQLHMGSSGLAGEIGHTPVCSARDVACRCGLSGCLEAVAGGAALVQATQDLGNYRSLGDLIAAAPTNGDIRDRLDTAAETVGRALGPLVTVLNPDAVIVGGAVDKQASPVLATGLMKGLQESALPHALDDATVAIGDSAIASTCRGALIDAADAALISLLSR